VYLKVRQKGIKHLEPDTLSDLEGLSDETQNTLEWRRKPRSFVKLKAAAFLYAL
jgi:hypothetical protein